MGVIRRAILTIIGPGVDKLLDMHNVCRCISCCTIPGGFMPCENKTADDERECNWCKGANAGQYPHCHGMGNSMLAGGWNLEGPK
jgi:hypothetical protein